MARRKILVVDDAETILLMERMILSKGAYDIVVAKNGEEAVAKAAAEHPDLILMDVMMPNMNGFEACSQIRKNQETRAIPIIMVTTRGEEENIKKGFENGCTDYITKPINGVELLSKVRNYLGQ